MDINKQGYGSPHVAVIEIQGGALEADSKAVMHYVTRDDALEDVAYLVDGGHKLLGFYPVPTSLH